MLSSTECSCSSPSLDKDSCSSPLLQNYVTRRWGMSKRGGQIKLKAGMVCVWVAGKTVWSPCYTRPYLSALRWWYTTSKALYKYQTFTYFLYATACQSCDQISFALPTKYHVYSGATQALTWPHLPMQCVRVWPLVTVSNPLKHWCDVSCFCFV